MLANYLKKQNLNHDAVHLFVHHFIRATGAGLLGMFGVIYIYKLFGDVRILFLYQLILYGLIFATMPLAMKLVNKIGFKKSMIISLGFFIVFYLTLFAASQFSQTLLWLGIALLAQYINILLYWVPYHTDFALLTDKKKRAENYAMLTSFIAIISIALPILSAGIISYYGFGLLFLLTIIVVFFSSFPLFKISEINEQFTFTVRQTYRELFSKKNRHLFIGHFADGAQAWVGAIVWPIFIFILLDGDFFSVGFIASLVVMVTIVVKLIFGNLSDHMSKTKIVKFVSIFHAAGWVIKSFVASPFQIFAAATYHDLTGSATRVTFDSLMYEQAGQHKHYADEYSVLREISLCLSRVFVMLIALVVVSFFSLEIMFWIAAAASLFLRKL